MAFNSTRFAAYSFLFFFAVFLAVHYAWVKTPSQYRGIASDKSAIYPMYDASFKL